MTSLKDLREQWYMESYEDFINYFENKKNLERKDIILGIAMAYSWMPTIPKIPKIKEKEVNLVKELIDSVDVEKFKDLVRIVNNSIVGTSKLLHFIAPNTYPIWDRRVCAYNKKYKVNSFAHYFDYKKYCENIINNELKYEKYRKDVEKRYGKDKIRNYSRLRILDLWILMHVKPRK